jgi:hypothetical protein
MNGDFNEVWKLVESLQDEILDECELRKATDLGLDQRCGDLYVPKNKMFIATMNARAIDYYGGFEYIDTEHTVSIGSLKVYSAEADRVETALSYLEPNSD